MVFKQKKIYQKILKNGLKKLTGSASYFTTDFDKNFSMDLTFIKKIRLCQQIIITVTMTTK